MPVGLIIEFRL